MTYLSYAQSFDRLKRKNWTAVVPGSVGLLSFLEYRGGSKSGLRFNESGFLLGVPLLAFAGYQFYNVKTYNKNLTEVLNKYDKTSYTILPKSTVNTLLLIPVADTSKIMLRIK